MQYNMKDISHAINIITGTWVDITTVYSELIDTNTPEDYVIAKNAFASLSTDAQIFINLIQEMADEFVKLNGTMKEVKFKNFLKSKLGWKNKKIETIKAELKTYFKSL